MTTKHTQIIAFKIDEATEASLDNLLNQYDRETYPTKSDLLRDLLDIGLKKHWNKINRENDHKATQQANLLQDQDQANRQVQLMNRNYGGNK